MKMDRYKFLWTVTAALTFNVIGAAGFQCPTESNCICGGTFSVELKCDIDGNSIVVNLLPNTYISIQCTNPRDVDYSKFPRISANNNNTYKSIIFKECPLPYSSFNDVLKKLGVSKTMALIFQNSKNLSSNLDKRQFSGLQDLSKLLLSVNGMTYLPDNLFEDVSNLTWLNIRSSGISLTENLFKPLERLETLEISHNHMTNISGNLFSHLAFLRKLSLWQNNVTRFSKDLFSGVNVLEELDLSSNGLNELPSSIFTPLRKLKKLTLFSNKFSTLPSNLFKKNEGLDTIIIFNNDVKLKILPKGIFSKLTHLKEVYVQRCGLEVIPLGVFTGSPLITNISLAHNDIENLQESVFNDQINLIDLDLSHNKLKALEPKLFSSLVKLERLKLSYNSIKEISSFSSLLSLTYFDIEHNKVESISSNIFTNNRQRMWINLAYNELKFQENVFDYNSTDIEVNLLKPKSPFAHLFHLKMLNLSHNELQNTYEDWWINGHEKIDISYNKIYLIAKYGDNYNELLAYSKRLAMKSHTISTKFVWISMNPLTCDCSNFLFLTAIQKEHTKICDIDSFQCPITLKLLCDNFITKINMEDMSKESRTILPILLCVVSFLAAIIYCVIKFKNHIYVRMKRFLYNFYYYKDNRSTRDIIIAYSREDEQFVETELFPVLSKDRGLRIHARPLNRVAVNDMSVSKLMNSYEESGVLVIVLSSNYLNILPNDIDIKDIYGDTLNKENIVFVLVSDFGSEVALNPFLKANLINMNQCVAWRETQFWTKFSRLMKTKNGQYINCVDFSKVNEKDVMFLHSPNCEYNFNELPL